LPGAQGDPKNIHDWSDLVRSDVKLIFPNPKTSGNARYTYLAAWGAADNADGGDKAKTEQFMTQFLKNVEVFDTGGRGATTTFAERGLGDVLISFESEVNNIRKQYEAHIYEMTSELAKRLGVEQQFTEGRTQEEWMRHLYEQSRKSIPNLPTFEEFRKQGIFKQRDPEGHHVAYKDFREDPQANPLTTPSGKIEIYSQALADIAATWELPEGDVIDPLPIYTPGFENYNDPLTDKFPLQLTGFHYKARVHSTYGNVDVLKAACRQEMWINPMDAQKRGINNGDKVRIFNDRGEVHIEAKVTPRMMPGVVALGEGAWYDPDAKRVDQGGCINVLTTQRPSPLAKGNPSHTNLVQVEKA
ncbi:anaerobic dimethyl sulfoxide reductase subunit A, partial [Salmonella enterica subsp. enterica serovar Enteritidis str. 6.0562-1]